jgi:integrase
MPTINHFYLRDRFETLRTRTLSEKSIESLSDTRSVNTLDAYESDWNDFCDWCRFHGENAFPASSETIVNYINDLADNAKISTIRRRISAISENFNAAGLEEKNPCRAWIVKEALTGLSRRLGTAQKGKTPVYWEDLERIIALMNPAVLADVRDKAILLTGFMGAFRRSELSGLDAENLARFPQGLVITVTQSKTDQKKVGQQIGIPYIENRTMCAVRALEEWMNAGNIHKGPLFRSFLRNGKVSGRRLSDKSMNLILKKWVSQIGLDPDQYGAHSLRHGFATYAALHGVEERLIMKQTRHRSVEMVRHYINEADLFVNNPVAMIFDRQKK